jgi:DNA-binding IclR family transcriptional regulator
MKNEPSPYFSKSLEKGLKILGLFAAAPNKLGLKEISQMLGSNKSSIYRFVNTLVKLEYINKDPRTKILTLAPKSYLLGLDLSRNYSLLQIIKPFIDEAFNTYGVNVDSAFLRGNMLLKLYQRVAHDTLTYHSFQVETALHCHALSKAILAFLPENEMSEIIDGLRLVKKTENSLTNKNDLKADLKRTRERGYAINNEEFIPGLIALAAPFFDRKTNRPVGAVSFDFFTASHSLKQAEKRYPPFLLQLAGAISQVI